jgi:hypothetical protein
VAAWSSDAAAESKLQWRRGRIPSRTADRPAQQSDAAVRQVAYDEGRPDEPRGQATLRGVVIDHGSQADAIRTAQLPPPDGDTGYDQQLRAPFAGVPGPDDSDLDGRFNESEPMQAPNGESVPGVKEMHESPVQPPPPTFAAPAQSPSASAAPPVAADPFDNEPPERNYALGATSMADEAKRAKEFCSTELEHLKASTLKDVSLSIAVSGSAGTDYPYECSIDDGTQYPERCWPQTTYMWKASALCHKPLYFENEQLERYGHSWGPYVQPLVSGAHFFSRLPILPYEMGLEPPNECIYALGHYRPGSCAPYMIDPVPFTWRAGLFEAGAVVGTAWVLP